MPSDEDQSSLLLEQATKFCSDGCFHQSLWLPATTSRLRLRITFATSTNFVAGGLEEMPTVLFCLPMGASRLSIYEWDYVACEVGVRLIFIDR